MKDYIIVGGGLAGISFAETAFLNNKTFTVIDKDLYKSSFVAAGLYNPVILKRFSMPANWVEQLEYIYPFYKKIEDRLGIKVNYKIPVYRKFISVEEQNNWFAASDKPELSSFLSTDIVYDTYSGIASPFGYGKVLSTGYIDTTILLKSYHEFLDLNNNLIREDFNYSSLIVRDDYVEYNNLKARNIIFSEGFGMTKNPFFCNLPLEGTKGELLVIKAPNLKLDVAINAGVYIIPIGNDLYKVGATYEWYDKTPMPTAAGRKELIYKLEKLISCDYEIVNHLAEIRPTVKDRRALLGTHYKHKRMYVLNGLGTRGVMLGPSLALELYNLIEFGTPIEKSIDINRFKF